MRELYIGRTDTPLTPAGGIHARKLAQRLKGLKSAHVLSSPLRRALETARPIARETGADIHTDDDLSEIDFGRWEKMSFKEIAACDPELVGQWARDLMNFRFPDGEGMSAFWERLGRAEHRMRQIPEETVVAVTHGGVIRFLICRFLGLDPLLHLAFEILPGSITTIHLSEANAVLSGLNDLNHLKEC